MCCAAVLLPSPPSAPCGWIEVILKYKSFTPFYATVLWYLYYVPMTLIPLLYQL